MKKYLEILKKVALFNGIGEENLQGLLICLGIKIVHYNRGQTLFSSGTDTLSLGIVLSGQVHIVKEDYYGNRHIIACIDAGNIFGEAFVCAEIKTLPVSISAITESDIMFIDYHKIIAPCSNACAFHGKLIDNMLKIIARKNILLSQKIDLISRRSTREKLLAYLSFQAENAHSSHFSIPFNRQELADYLSVDRSAMSAELCKMRDEGLLQFNKNQFELFTET